MSNKWKQHFTGANAKVNWILVVALLVSAFCAFKAISTMQKNYVWLTQVREGELKNQNLRLKNTNLELQKAYFQTAEFMELQARTKLNKAMPGEHLVILPKTNKTLEEVSGSGKTDRVLTNPQQWAQFLLGVRYE